MRPTEYYIRITDTHGCLYAPELLGLNPGASPGNVSWCLELDEKTWKTRCKQELDLMVYRIKTAVFFTSLESNWSLEVICH
jgi:hypothetical protein